VPEPYPETSEVSVSSGFLTGYTRFPLSQITDNDIRKEAEPSEFIKTALPILQKNGVVHFLGFGNRLGFDSVPVHLQVTVHFHEHIFQSSNTQCTTSIHILFRHQMFAFAEAAVQMQLPRSEVHP
jgi:hypothetical protein